MRTSFLHIYIYDDDEFDFASIIKKLREEGWGNLLDKTSYLTLCNMKEVNQTRDLTDRSKSKHVQASPGEITLSYLFKSGKT